MKLITRDTDYALRVLCHLAGRKHRTAVVAIARDLKIPGPFLRRITQRMSKAGLLVSARGLAGGFVLAVRPENIRLLDVAEIFQGSFRLNECLFKKKVCPNRRSCFLRRQLLDIERYALEKFASLTVADIAAKESSHGQKEDHQDR